MLNCDICGANKFDKISPVSGLNHSTHFRSNHRLLAASSRTKTNASSYLLNRISNVTSSSSLHLGLFFVMLFSSISYVGSGVISPVSQRPTLMWFYQNVPSPGRAAPPGIFAVVPSVCRKHLHPTPCFN